MLVAIEGMTNAGKSTTCGAVAALLRSDGVPCVELKDLVVRDPISTRLKSITNPAGFADELDANTELMLYAGHLSRKAHLLSRVSADAPDAIVIADRWSLSVSAFFVHVRGLPPEVVAGVTAFASRGIEPDVTVFLDVSLSTTLERSALSPFSRKDIGLESYWTALRAGYLDGLKESPGRTEVFSSDREDPRTLARRIVRVVL
ncbi:dTMP kinase [Micromonospora sp. NPDC049580]|uniref:dTMP kinase n=1 Tax=Micromonospora sp. NPDC049580 TaxID=3154832 RepID=UPI00342D5F21